MAEGPGLHAAGAAVLTHLPRPQCCPRALTAIPPCARLLHAPCLQAGHLRIPRPETIPGNRATRVRRSVSWSRVRSGFGAESIAPTELLVRAADALRQAEADDRAAGSTRRPGGGHNQNCRLRKGGWRSHETARSPVSRWPAPAPSAPLRQRLTRSPADTSSSGTRRPA
jgi:hypothetical protein